MTTDEPRRRRRKGRRTPPRSGNGYSRGPAVPGEPRLGTLGSAAVYDIHLAYRDYRTALLAELQEAVLRELRLRSVLEPKGAVGPDTLVIAAPRAHIPVACVRRDTGWEYCMPDGGPTIAPAANLRAVLTWVEKEAEPRDEEPL